MNDTSFNSESPFYQSNYQSSIECLSCIPYSEAALPLPWHNCEQGWGTGTWKVPGIFSISVIVRSEV